MSDPLPQISLKLRTLSLNNLVMAIVRPLDVSDRHRSHVIVPMVDTQFTLERIAHVPRQHGKAHAGSKACWRG